MRRLDVLHLFLWRTSALNVYYLQCLYSSMRFRNDSVFTEIFLNCIKLNRIVFARFGSVWTGKVQSQTGEVIPEMIL